MREGKNEFLPDSLPPGLPVLDLLHARRISSQHILCPIQNHQFLKQSDYSFGMITHETVDVLVCRGREPDRHVARVTISRNAVEVWSTSMGPIDSHGTGGNVRVTDSSVPLLCRW